MGIADINRFVSVSFRGAMSASGRSVNRRVLSIAAGLASITIAARALGMASQIVISDRFGAGAAMDAYFATLALPALLTNLVVGALEASVIPVYSRLHATGQEDEATRVLSTLLNLVLLVLGAFTLCMLLAPEATLRIVAPGVSARTIEIGAALAPWVFPTLLLNVAVGFVTSVLNTRRRFALPAVTTMLIPAGILLGTLALGAAFGIRALAIGLLAGTVVQLLTLLAMLRDTRIRYLPVLHTRHPDVRLALRQFWPMLLGAAIGHANPVIDQIVASPLGTGQISSLNYSLKLINIPVTVLFMANSRAIFPYFSSHVATRDMAGLKDMLRLFVWITGLLSLGTSVIFAVFARPIVDVLFHRGAFTARDAAVTAAALVGFSVGLFPMALGFLVPRVYNALRRSDLLFRFAVFTLIANIALDIPLAHYFQLPGIALATSIDYLLTTILQVVVLRRLVGPLYLFTPPAPVLRLAALPRQMLIGRVVELRRQISQGPRSAISWRSVRNAALVIVGLISVGMLTFRHAVQGVRFALALALATFFLRSPYVLLLAWAGLGALFDVTVGGHSLGLILLLASIPAIAFIVRRRYGDVIRRAPAVVSFLLLLIWILPGALRSPLGLYQFGIEELGLANYLAVLVLAIAVLTTRPRFERFLTVLLTASALLAALGVCEYILRFGGYQDPAAAFIYRVGGIYGWSNSFGFYLDMLLPFCLYRALTAPRPKQLVWTTVLALHAVALLLTFGRAVIASAAIAALVAALLMNRHARRWLLGSLAVLGAGTTALMLVPILGLKSRVLGEHLATLNDRTVAWRALLSHLDLHNPLGHGFFTSYALLMRIVPGGVGAPHSLYLQTLYESGLVGFVLLIATFALLIAGAIRRALHSDGPARVAAAVSAGGLVGAAIYLVVGTEFLDFALGLQFWLLAAVPFLPAWDHLPTDRRPVATAAPINVAEEQRPSVLFLIHQFLPYVGGAELRALRDAVALQASGHSVRILTLRLDRALARQEVIDGVLVQRIGGLFIRGRLRLRFGAQWLPEFLLFRELLRSRQSYDVIHLRQLGALARPAALVARFTRKSLLVRLGAGDPGSGAPAGRHAVAHLLAGPLDPSLPFLRVSARNWAVGDIATVRRTQWLAGVTLWLLKRPGVMLLPTSTRMRAYLLRHGFPASHVVVLPNGVDVATYRSAAHVISMRTEMSSLTVLCVSRLRFEKGLDVLLQAWPAVRAAEPRARLQLVGGGDLRAQLEQLARALGIEDSVHFVDHVSDVRPFLAAADIFALPSRWEGMPNALMEAMACGLPCVATRVSGSEDLIRDGESGLLVPPNAPVTLAAALISLLRDPERRRDLGTAARECITTRFDQRKLTHDLADLYARALATRPALVPEGAGHQRLGPVAETSVGYEGTVLDGSYREVSEYLHEGV